MTDSPHYSDHLIAALRCLSDCQLERLAQSIIDRVKWPKSETFPEWYEREIGIPLADAKKRGVTDLNLLEKAWKDSAANWCAEAARQSTEKDQWEACAQRLEARLDAMTKPIECKLTMEEKLAYVEKLKTECTACNGKGWFIFYNWREECQPCGGTGKIITLDRA